LGALWDCTCTTNYMTLGVGVPFFLRFWFWFCGLV
jgi:hypothetical protein